MWPKNERDKHQGLTRSPVIYTLPISRTLASTFKLRLFSGFEHLVFLALAAEDFDIFFYFFKLGWPLCLTQGLPFELLVRLCFPRDDTFYICWHFEA